MASGHKGNYFYYITDKFYLYDIDLSFIVLSSNFTGQLISIKINNYRVSPAIPNTNTNVNNRGVEIWFESENPNDKLALPGRLAVKLENPFEHIILISTMGQYMYSEYKNPIRQPKLEDDVENIASHSYMLTT